MPPGHITRMAPKCIQAILQMVPPHEFYYPEDHPTIPGWFKGIQGILEECGLWLDSGLPSQCHGFKSEARNMDYCCQQLLFMQHEFCLQCSQLEEYITAQGHICDFYPKYHCELNFIGVWQNSCTRFCHAPWTLMKWRRICLHVWTVSLFPNTKVFLILIKKFHLLLTLLKVCKPFSMVHWCLPNGDKGHPSHLG